MNFKKLTTTATLPKYGSTYAAGMDLFADLPNGSMVIHPHTTAHIPTGIAMAIPKGYVGLLVPRSGLSLRTHLRQPHCVGVIDNDYRGEVKGMFENTGDEPFVVEHGMRFAQLIVSPFVRVLIQEADALDETERGVGGFGSTGLK